MALTFQAGGNHSSDTEEEEEEEEEKEEKEEDEEEEKDEVKTTAAEIDARDGCAVSKSVTIQEPEYEEEEEEEQAARSPERSPSPPPVHEEAEEEEPEDRWRSSSPERKHSNGSDSYEEEQRASSMSPEPPRAIVKPANSAPAPTPAPANSNSNSVKPSTPVHSPSSQDRDITKIYTGALGSAAAPAKDFSAEKVIRNKPASDITQIYTQVFRSYNILLCLVRISLGNKLDLELNTRTKVAQLLGYIYVEEHLAVHILVRFVNPSKTALKATGLAKPNHRMMIMSRNEL